MDLLRRDWAPAVTLELVGPERLTGESVARTWSAAPGRTVTYGGAMWRSSNDRWPHAGRPGLPTTCAR